MAKRKTKKKTPGTLVKVKTGKPALIARRAEMVVLSKPPGVPAIIEVEEEEVALIPEEPPET